MGGLYVASHPCLERTCLVDYVFRVSVIPKSLQVLSLEYGVVVQEQEEAKRRAEEASTKMGQMFRAARVIQRGWKRYIEKKKSKKKGKKKGKKGKKGEKGKGGKKKKKKS